MESMFENLSDNEKNILMRIGVLRIGEAVFEGVPPIDRVRRNIRYIMEKTKLSEEEIFECYKFISDKSFIVGKSGKKERNTVGFIQNH